MLFFSLQMFLAASASKYVVKYVDASSHQERVESCHKNVGPNFAFFHTINTTDKQKGLSCHEL